MLGNLGEERERERGSLVSLSLVRSRTRGSRNRELVKPGVPLSGKRIGGHGVEEVSEEEG